MRRLARLLPLFCIIASAQTPTLTKPTNAPKTLSLAVVVHDKKGNPITGLTAADFVLSAGGRTGDKKPQPIVALGPASSVPLTLGLLVDVSTSERDAITGGIAAERTSATTFLNTVLTPGSRGFVMHFAKPIELLQDTTTDQAKLATATRALGTQSPTFSLARDAQDGTLDAEGRRVRSGGTSLYDTLFLASDEIVSKLTGRKVLVLVTDGVDVNSKENLNDALEAAQRANAIVYAVLVRTTQKQDREQERRRDTTSTGGSSPGTYPGSGGGGYPSGTGGYPGSRYPSGGGGGNRPTSGPTSPSRKPSIDGKQVLDRICGETGGAVFEVNKKQTLDEAFAAITAELQAQARLTFTPDELAGRYGYHQIDLKLTGARATQHLDVQVRDGYYGAEGK